MRTIFLLALLLTPASAYPQTGPFQGVWKVVKDNDSDSDWRGLTLEFYEIPQRPHVSKGILTYFENWEKISRFSSAKVAGPKLEAWLHVPGVYGGLEGTIEPHGSKQLLLDLRVNPRTGNVVQLMLERSRSPRRLIERPVEVELIKSSLPALGPSCVVPQGRLTTFSGKVVIDSLNRQFEVVFGSVNWGGAFESRGWGVPVMGYHTLKRTECFASLVAGLYPDALRFQPFYFEIRSRRSLKDGSAHWRVRQK